MSSKFPGVTVSSVLTGGTFGQLWAVPYSKGNVSGTFVTPFQEVGRQRAAWCGSSQFILGSYASPRINYVRHMSVREKNEYSEH